MPIGNPSVTAKEAMFRLGGRTALAAASFEIPSGGLTALIGPNGSGKSTLLNGVSGLIKPSSGTLTVNPLDGRARRISYVLQTTKVNESLPVTVREVVTMGRYSTTGPYRRLTRSDRQRVDAALERMGVTDLANLHLSELSGGQRQRVFVAQGLTQDHDILLLDEPLTGLDIVSMRAIDKVIHAEVEHGCTVVLTTHDIAEASTADHVILLAGRVVSWGPPSEVLTQENLMKAYGMTGVHTDSEGILFDDPTHRPADKALHNQ